MAWDIDETRLYRVARVETLVLRMQVRWSRLGIQILDLVSPRNCLLAPKFIVIVIWMLFTGSLPTLVRKHPADVTIQTHQMPVHDIHLPASTCILHLIGHPCPWLFPISNPNLYTVCNTIQVVHAIRFVNLLLSRPLQTWKRILPLPSSRISTTGASDGLSPFQAHNSLGSRLSTFKPAPPAVMLPDPVCSM